MPGGGGGSTEQQRTVIAQHAARMVIDHGINDYGFAKRKAAEQLGIVAEAALPSNREVEQALLEHQRLFGGETAQALLRDMRRGALEALKFFQRFDPRIAGGVLSGAVSAHTPIVVHLFTDAPEDVARMLLDAGMRFDTAELRLRFSNHRALTCPVHRFNVHGNDYEAVVLASDAIREAPLSAVDGRPERRANRRELEALLISAQDDGMGVLR